MSSEQYLNISQIPVSKARLQRREKVKNTTPTTKKTVDVPKKGQKWPRLGIDNRKRIDIKNYKPDNTWARGGRLKEIRIRYIARKYVKFWQKKTFGRILPSTATYHYRQVLLVKTYSIWNEFWWKCVKEWRLEVRADCQYKYKRCLVFFGNWRQFVLRKRVQNKKHHIASNYYHTCLKASVISAWKLRVEAKHKKIHHKKEADEFKSNSLTRIAWRTWKYRHEAIAAYKDDQETAQQFFLYRIQAQHWIIWKKAIESKREQHAQLKEAKIHHNTVLVCRCIKAWLIYTHMRRKKNLDKDLVKKLYENRMKLSSFNHWYQRWYLRQSLRLHHIQMNELATRFTLRWALWRWKNYVEDAKFEAARHRLAVQHYHQNILKRNFDSIYLNLIHSRIKKTRILLANQLRTKQLTRFFWQQWNNAIEMKEDAKMSQENELARDVYKVKLMRQSLYALADFCQWRKQRKDQYIQADAHYYIRVMPKYLFYMRVFVSQEKSCRDNAVKSEEFLKHNIFFKFFMKWKDTLIQKRNQRIAKTMAILHREQILKHLGFSRWKNQLIEKNKYFENICIADNHHKYQIKTTVFEHWLMYVSNRKKSVKNCIAAIRFHNHKTLLNCFQQWKVWINRQKKKKILNEIASNHLKRKRYDFCIYQWKAFVCESRNFKMIGDTKFEYLNKILLYNTFINFKWAVNIQKVKKSKLLLAESFSNQKLLSKVVQEWQTVTALRIYRRSEEEQATEKLKVKIHRLHIGLYFRTWATKSKELMDNKIQMDKAIRLNNLNILRKSLAQWKMFGRENLKKKLLVNQSRWFSNVRLTAKHFLVWKQRLSDSHVERNQTNLALWQWSLVLQKRILLLWKDYTKHRKEQKTRIEDAMRSRKISLIKDACLKWLTTVDSFRQSRSAIAEKNQFIATCDKFNTVRKVALFWKSKAENRRKRAFINPKTGLSFQNSETLVPAFSVTTCVEPLQPIPRPMIGQFSPEKLLQSNEDRIVNKIHRPLPKRPAFLVDSLQRAGFKGYLSSVDDETTEARQFNLSPETFEAKLAALPHSSNSKLKYVANEQKENGLNISGEPVPFTLFSDIPQKSMEHLNVNTNCSLGNQSKFATQIKLLQSSQSESTNIVQNTCFSDIVLLKPEDFMKYPSTKKALDRQIMSLPLSPVDRENPSPTYSESNRSDKASALIHVSFNKNNSSTTLDKKLLHETSLSFEQEIKTIRDELKYYNKQKEKLRLLRKQYSHLSDALSSNSEKTEITESDEEYRNLTLSELQSIETEIKEMECTIRKQRPHCEHLIARVKELTEKYLKH